LTLKVCVNICVHRFTLQEVGNSRKSNTIVVIFAVNLLKLALIGLSEQVNAVFSLRNKTHRHLMIYW